MSTKMSTKMSVCVRAQLSGPLRSPAAPPQAACFSRSCSRYRALVLRTLMMVNVF